MVCAALLTGQHSYNLNTPLYVLEIHYTKSTSVEMENDSDNEELELHMDLSFTIQLYLPSLYHDTVMFHCMLHSKFHIVYNFESGLRSQKFTLIKLLLESFHIEFYFQRNNDKLCIFIIQKIFYICTGFLGITMHLILSLCLIKVPP